MTPHSSQVLVALPAEGPPTPLVDPAVVAARVLRMRRRLLHDVRWREPVLDRRGIAIALAVVLVLHVIFALVVRDGMRLRALMDDRRDVIRVTLIERPETMPELAPAPLHELPTLAVKAPQAGSARNAAAPQRRERAVREVAPAQTSEQGVEAIVETAPAPSLYNPDGSLRMAPAEPAAAATHDPIARGKEVAKELRQRGHNVVRCQPTRFARAYSPDENVGDKFARKYLAVVGLYNPHSAKMAAERRADAVADCDWQGF